MSDRPELNYVTVYHRAPCSDPKCRLRSGDMLIETWNRGKASVDLEEGIAKTAEYFRQQLSAVV